MSAQPPPAVPESSGPVPSIPSTSEERTMGMLSHLLGIFTGFLGPLIIWLIKKDQSAFVADQGKEALNFQITMLIVWIGGVVLSIIYIGLLIMLAAFACSVIFGIMGTMAANRGEVYRYPFALRLIK